MSTYYVLGVWDIKDSSVNKRQKLWFLALIFTGVKMNSMYISSCRGVRSGMERKEAEKGPEEAKVREGCSQCWGLWSGKIYLRSWQLSRDLKWWSSNFLISRSLYILQSYWRVQWGFLCVSCVDICHTRNLNHENAIYWFIYNHNNKCTM